MWKQYDVGNSSSARTSGPAHKNAWMRAQSADIQEIAPSCWPLAGTFDSHGRFAALRKGELGGSTERYLARACFAHRPFRLLTHLRSFAAAKLCGTQTLAAQELMTRQRMASAMPPAHCQGLTCACNMHLPCTLLEDSGCSRDLSCLVLDGAKHACS